MSSTAELHAEQPGYHPLVERIWSFLHNDLHDLNIPNTKLEVMCPHCITVTLEYRAIAYIAVYCRRCGYPVNAACYWPQLPADISQRLGHLRVLKQLLYNTVSSQLPPLPLLPHDSATCPLCVVPDAAYIRNWLLQDGRAAMEESIDCAIGELHCWPQPTVEQQRTIATNGTHHFSIDFQDLDLPRTFVDSPSVPVSSGQRAVLWGWLNGAAQYECEVVLDDGWEERQLDSPVRMQPLSWRFVLCKGGWSHELPMLSELSADCEFWKWRQGTVDRQWASVDKLEYRC